MVIIFFFFFRLDYMYTVVFLPAVLGRIAVVYKTSGNGGAASTLSG